MVNLYLLIGIAGCGKSTWANEQLANGLFDIILSSDQYRIDMYGDVNDQTHNGEIFNKLRIDTIKYLKEGKSVCYDATNLNRKDRKSILTAVKDSKLNCNIVGVLFEVEESIIRQQNASRDRVVPDFVIDKMIRKFEMPLHGEGFNDFIYIRRNLEVQTNYKDIMKLEKNFDLDNPNHSMDLYHHSVSASLITTSILQDTKSDNNIELQLAALLHDIGKLYTKTFDKEKGYSHFYSHENVGAYKALFLDYYPFKDVNKELIATYINYHMEEFRLKDAKESVKQKHIAEIGEKLWNDICILHKGDLSAH